MNRPASNPLSDPSVVEASKLQTNGIKPINGSSMVEIPLPSSSMNKENQMNNTPTRPITSLNEMSPIPPPPSITTVNTNHSQYNKPNQPNLVEEIGISIKSTDSNRILMVMKMTNIILSLATVSVGVLSWILGYALTIQKVIASIYIVLFGLLLLIFELRNEKIDTTIHKNFGFMYGYKSRTLFLLFIAIWPLSMGNHAITIIDAVFLFLNAFFNFYVVYHHPAFAGPSQPIYEGSSLDSKNNKINTSNV